MSRHTPGPWIAVGLWVEHPNDNIADICTCNPEDVGQAHLGRSDSEACANARLIAAAPDLLQCLKWMVELYELKCLDENGFVSGPEHAASLMAIIKATGGLE
jgi:hypothetical protein